MAGIYIHIPFCRKACHYCNFHFSTSLKLKNDFITALLREIEITSAGTGYLPGAFSMQPFLENEVIDTIYIGGGTPSLLNAEDLNSIVNKISTFHNINSELELTIEANPDDINLLKLQEWKAIGINRLSIGVQSFFDEDLKWMNRVHNSNQARESISLAQQEGFENITIDLIYGSPTLSDEKWKENVEIAIKTGVPHISCYALTVEPSTVLSTLIQQRKVEDVDQEKQAHQFLLLMTWLKEAGYDHYEISNFAKPGKRSRHNTSYWQGRNYLGLGPSAHSFNGRQRQWNVSNNALYIQSLQNHILPVEKEILTTKQKINEYIMTSLRTIEGLDLAYLEKEFGMMPVEHVQKAGRKYLEQGRVKQMEKILALTDEGKLYADGIASDLFL